MAPRSAASPVRMGFECETIRITILSLVPLRQISQSTRTSSKYIKIATSMREVGMVEPPVVARDSSRPDRYLLLDGHIRIDILKFQGETEVTCLIAQDDEAFTYNRHINRLATVQEHKMLLKAVERGVSEERLARTFNIAISTLKARMRMLDGICPEAIEILKDRHIPAGALAEMKKMMPLRQIEAAGIMVAMNCFSIPYAKTLVGATPTSQILAEYRIKPVREVSPEQKNLMEVEAARLDHEVKMIEESYGADHLDLVLARGYLSRLLGNAAVVRHLAKHHPDILSEFQKLAEAKRPAA
jgi:hypothetical protein